MVSCTACRCRRRRRCHAILIWPWTNDKQESPFVFFSSIHYSFSSAWLAASSKGWSICLSARRLQPGCTSLPAIHDGKAACTTVPGTKGAQNERPSHQKVPPVKEVLSVSFSECQPCLDASLKCNLSIFGKFPQFQPKVVRHVFLLKNIFEAQLLRILFNIETHWWIKLAVRLIFLFF